MGAGHLERQGRQAEVDALAHVQPADREALKHDAFVGETLAGMAVRFAIKF
jgi:hypothetical protein